MLGRGVMMFAVVKGADGLVGLVRSAVVIVCDGSGPATMLATWGQTFAAANSTAYGVHEGSPHDRLPTAPISEHMSARSGGDDGTPHIKGMHRARVTS